jgi:hypothetical protein
LSRSDLFEGGFAKVADAMLMRKIATQAGEGSR